MISSYFNYVNVSIQCYIPIYVYPHTNHQYVCKILGSLRIEFKKGVGVIIKSKETIVTRITKRSYTRTVSILTVHCHSTDTIID